MFKIPNRLLMMMSMLFTANPFHEIKSASHVLSYVRKLSQMSNSITIRTVGEYIRGAYFELTRNEARLSQLAMDTRHLLSSLRRKRKEKMSGFRMKSRWVQEVSLS